VTTTATPQFSATDGSLWLIPGATPVPPIPVAPVIPSNAKNTGSIIAMPGWKMEWDDGTQGSATNIKMVYDPVKKIATFSADQTGKAGVRWSITAVKNVPDTITHFVYDIIFQLPDPSQQACIEMDVNQVTNSNGENYFLCVQASQYSKSYEYSLKNAKGGIGWNKSNIPVSPEQWPKNTDKHIRIFSYRDANGNVFYEGVEEDSKYSAYTSTAQGNSSESLGWTKGIILPNFQMDGANASGTMVAVVSNFNISYW
jgi:hypothetical protein